eukprot:CAMPEP_0197417752 /NCGR_PEP_ID=MMETSP1170-20131217/3704_1 /TAXON_ID=54406 /ORGANISM="Sarcinochrysis sp, Strain CCMP770" /LENGTH=54 /DNA_ID=CAMNT_0042944739 /DNA_START=99 /DNA_END=260 /DNA_ORIENTATION=+
MNRLCGTGARHITNTTEPVPVDDEPIMSFVRDPLERFQSGIFELTKRGEPWIMA